MERCTVRFRASRAAVALGLAVSVVACQSSTPTASPSGTNATGGTGWTRARVEQPAAIEAAPTGAPTFCSPCHPILGTYAASLVPFHGGYLALGYDLPPSHAAAWQAGADAAAWKRVGALPAPEGSAISAAVAAEGSGIVAVGTAGGRAAIWRSADGVAWTLAQLAAPGGGGTEQLTAIARTPSGTYVAGGYVESPLAVRTASLWRSANGTDWTRATLPAGPAGPTEITGVAGRAGTVVAVGIAGDERRGTAAVWRSPDGGATWDSISGPAATASSLAIGRMLAVASAGRGFVAVGENRDQTGAAAWYSIDGRTWTPAAGPALQHDGTEMVMLGVSPESGGAAAAGWLSDAGNGSVAVWRSPDGLTWTRLPADPSFSGAGAAGVLAGPRLLVYGTMGWPDTHAAQVWIGPSR